jgi:hypothetical protein
METVCPAFGPCYQVKVSPPQRPKHETPRQKFERKHGIKSMEQKQEEHIQNYRRVKKVRDFFTL